MVVHYYRCEKWDRINRGMVEYLAVSSDHRRNEAIFISHCVVTIGGVSLHLWSMKPTKLRKETLITHIPPFIVICSNSYTKVLDRCSPSYASITLQIIEGIWYDSSWNPTRTISSMKVSTSRDITHKLYVYDLPTSFYRRPVSRAATVIASYWTPCLNIIVLFRIHATLKDRYWSNNPISSRRSLRRHTPSWEAHLFIVLTRSTFIFSCAEDGA